MLKGSRMIAGHEWMIKPVPVMVAISRKKEV